MEDLDLDDLLMRLGDDLLPSGIQLVLALTALAGMLIIWSSLFQLYRITSEDVRRSARDVTPVALLIRCMIGGLMTVPAAVFWRAADALMAGGGATESTVLAYMDGIPDTGYCERFTAVITLTFMLIGVIALYVAYTNADDHARGYNRNGYRTAIPYAVGGLACFFITDVVALMSATLGLTMGLDTLCTALGSPE